MARKELREVAYMKYETAVAKAKEELKKARKAAWETYCKTVYPQSGKDKIGGKRL